MKPPKPLHAPDDSPPTLPISDAVPSAAECQEPDDEDTLLGEVHMEGPPTLDQIVAMATLVHNAERDAFAAVNERMERLGVLIANLCTALPHEQHAEEWRGPVVKLPKAFIRTATEVIGLALAELKSMLDPVPDESESEIVDYIEQLRSRIEDSLI